MNCLNRRLVPFPGQPSGDEPAAGLVDAQVGCIVVGQDPMTGYAGNDRIRYQPFVDESIFLKVEEPGAVCILGRK